MAQGDRATLGLVKIATPALTIGGIKSWRLANAIARQVEGSGGQVDPTFVSIMGIKDSLSFSTLQLTALSSCGIAGCQITAADFYLQKMAAYGTRATGGSHTKLSVGTGLMVPRTLSWTKGGPATLDMEVLAISADGTTAPVIVAASQSLPAGGGVGEMFVLGPVSFNGTEMDIDRLTIDFGLQVQTEASGGHVYETFASIMARQPRITLTTPDLDAVASLDIEGLAQTETDSLVYFRKKAANGLFISDETASHILFSLDDGLLTMESGGATHGDRGTAELTFTPIYDGTNAIMVVTVGTAIT